MIKRWAAIGIAMWLSQFALAQHANDWIDYDPDRRYLKVNITEDGIYRISTSSLSTAMTGVGVDINDVDPRSIQVFGRGEEQYIHVEGQSDGSFDSGDYIEFYGESNDDWRTVSTSTASS
jgi:hypothetical protein